MLLLAFVLVYLVHRLPHDWTGSATLLISTYFLQQSVLFLASESMPQVLSLVNVNVLGDHVSHGNDASSDDGGVGAYAGVCIVPLDDTGRITMSLVSPLVAFALLGLLALLQLGIRAALLQHSSSSSNEEEEEEEGWARRIYRLVFVPSTPKLRLSEQAPSVRVHSGQLLSTSLLQESKVMESDPPYPPGSIATFLDRAPEDSASASPVWLSYQRTCVRLLQLSYTALAVVTLSFFHWQSVGEFGWRLVDYPTMSPGSDEYRAMLPFIVTVLGVVVCGLPLFVGIFLVVQAVATGTGTTVAIDVGRDVCQARAAATAHGHVSSRPLVDGVVRAGASIVVGGAVDRCAWASGVDMVVAGQFLCIGHASAAQAVRASDGQHARVVDAVVVERADDVAECVAPTVSQCGAVWCVQRAGDRTTGAARGSGGECSLATVQGHAWWCNECRV